MATTLFTPAYDAGRQVDYSRPLNRGHPLANGLIFWQMALPQWMQGDQVFDLCGLNNGFYAVANAAPSSSGWRVGPDRGGPRPGGFGALLNSGGAASSANAVAFKRDSYTKDLALGPMSISFWMLLNVINADSPVIQRNDNNTGTQGWVVGFQNSSQQFRFTSQRTTNLTVTAVTGTLAAKKWYHCTVTYAGPQAGSASTVLWYFMGNPVADSVTNAGVGSPTSDANQNLFMLGGQNAWSTANGYVDDVRLYRRLITPAEALDLYTNSRLGCPGLLNRTPKWVSVPAAVPKAAVIFQPAWDPQRQPDYTNPVNWGHPLAKSLVFWQMALPQLMRGFLVHNLINNTRGAALSFTQVITTPNTNGWRVSNSLAGPRPGGWGSLLFDGSTGFASLSPLGSLVPTRDLAMGPMSASFWLCINLATTNGAVIQRNDNALGDKGWCVAQASVNKQPRLTVEFGTTNLVAEASTGALAVGRWYHFTVTYAGPRQDTASIAWYMNGNPVANAATIAGAGTQTTDAAQPLQIGGNQSSFGFLNGQVDDVRLYRRIITPGEAFDLYTNSKIGCPGLLNRTPARVIVPGAAAPSPPPPPTFSPWWAANRSFNFPGRR
jgi:hypothetical protein